MKKSTHKYYAEIPKEKRKSFVEFQRLKKSEGKKRNLLKKKKIQITRRSGKIIKW